ncbi:MAG: Flp family type IVb pilin [Sphingomicrobium sp.]
MTAVRTWLRTLKRDERGATAIEYGLIAALIVVAIVGALAGLGGGVGGLWTKVSTNIQSAG